MSEPGEEIFLQARIDLWSNKDYEAAEEKLKRARLLCPQNDFVYIDWLLKECRDKMREAKKSKLSDTETKDHSTNTNYLKDNGNIKEKTLTRGRKIDEGELFLTKKSKNEYVTENKDRNKDTSDHKYNDCSCSLKGESLVKEYRIDGEELLVGNVNDEYSKRKTYNTRLNIHKYTETSSIDPIEVFDRHEKGILDKRVGQMYSGSEEKYSYRTGNNKVDDVRQTNYNRMTLDCKKPYIDCHAQHHTQVENDMQGIHSLHKTKSYTEKVTQTKPFSIYNIKDTHEVVVTEYETPNVDEKCDNESEFHAEGQIIINNKSDPYMTMQQENETEMIFMSFKMRAYVLVIGLRAFRSKPNCGPEVDFDEVSKKILYLIQIAEDSFKYNSLTKTEKYLAEAEELYSTVALILPQASISKQSKGAPRKETNNDNNNSSFNQEKDKKTTSYKEFVKGDNIDVIKCLKLAETALLAKDFKKAERLIKKSERICATKNAKALLEKVELAKKEEEQKAAAELEAARRAAEEEAARKEAEEKAIRRAAEKEAARRAAEEAARRTAEEEAARRTAEEEAARQAAVQKADEKSFEIEAAIQNAKSEIGHKYTGIETPESKNKSFKDHKKIIYNNNHEANNDDKMAAKSCLDIFQLAFNNKDFNKALKFLEKAKVLDSELDVNHIESQLRTAIASRSSSEYYSNLEAQELVFEPSNDKKKNSKSCYRIAEHYFKLNNMVRTEEFINRAKEYYCSLEVKRFIREIELLKRPVKTTIPEPSNMTSNSETQFGPIPESISRFTHLLPDPGNQKKIEELLAKGRKALGKGDVQHAKKCAIDSEKLSPNSAVELLKNIKVVESLQENCDKSILRSGREWKADSTSNIDNTTSSLKQRAEKWLEVAELEYSQGNLDLAVEYLDNAESLYPLYKSKSLFEKLRHLKVHENAVSQHDIKNEASTSSAFNKLQNEANIDAFNECIQKAEDAFAEGNLDRAERFMQKAYRMRPDDKLNISIKEIRNQKEIRKKSEEEHQKSLDESESGAQQLKQPKNHNQEEARRCVQFAEEVYEQGLFDKTEHLLKKALRMDPNSSVQDFLNKVQLENVKTVQETNVDIDGAAKNYETSKHVSKIEADNFFDMALTQICRNNYLFAESLLKKSENLHPSHDTTKLLEYVQNRIKANKDDYDITRSCQKPEKNVDKEAKKNSEKHLKQAREQFIKRDFKKAKTLCLKADRFMQSENAKDLLNNIFMEEYKTAKDEQNNDKVGNKSKQKPYEKNLTTFQAESFLEMGTIAFSNRDFELAKYYASQSTNIQSNVQARKLFFEALAEINNPDPTKNPHTGFLKNLRSGWTNITSLFY